MRAAHRNHDCRLRDFLWRGRRCISIENETLRAVFCADKGSDLIELLHKPTDTELLFQAPRGLGSVHDQTSTPLEVGHFRDLFPGGWYLMLPNGPEPCEYRGARFGQHGEATFLAWDVDVLEDRPQRVTVVFSTRLRRTPLAVERRICLELGSSTLVFDETLCNESTQPLEILWGHHPTFGMPFIEPGCRLDLPRCRASTAEKLPPDAALAPSQSGSWPHLQGREGERLDLSLLPEADTRSHDFIRLDNLEDGWYAISNPRRRLGFALKWDHGLFPTLGYWRLWHGGPDYPWYARHQLIALEPVCDLPSVAQAASRGTAIQLAAGATRQTRIEATTFIPAAPVSAVAWGGQIQQ